jgi:hypothetical protein
MVEFIDQNPFYIWIHLAKRGLDNAVHYVFIAVSLERWDVLVVNFDGSFDRVVKCA